MSGPIRIDVSFEAGQARDAIQQAAWEVMRPSVLMRPALSRDGNQFCALYGDDLQNGVAGFGNTPDEAMRAFDLEWFKPRTTQSPTPPEESHP